MNEQPTTIPQPIAQQAVEWYLDLQAGDADTKAFDAWLAQDVLHQQAWAQIESTNQRLQSLADPVARAAVLSPTGEQRRKAIKTLAWFLFAGGAATLAYRQTPWRELIADISTGTGEQRTIMLSDGSRLDLNSATAVNLEQQSEQLRLTLLKGEILITTAASGLKKSLSVETQQGRLQPVGTRFRVLQQGNTEIAVFEGRVAVSPRLATTEFMLERGQLGVMSADSLSGIGQVDENSTAWVDGMLIAARMSLGEFLQRLARHRTGYLGWDTAVAGLLVSGTFPLEDTDRILSSLEQILPIRVRRVTRYWVWVMPEN